MILCPVCGKGNGDLAVTCAQCHGYLQSRVDALDLFATAWGVIESPGRTFRKIALATHKNYTLFLSSLFGISWTFFAFRLTEAGLLLPNLFVLILAGLVGGPLLGIISFIFTSALGLWVGRRLGGDGSFRNVIALTSYASLPVVLSLVFVLPVEIGIFGLSLFGVPPSQWELKPVISLVLLVVQCGVLLWFAILLTVAVTVALTLPVRKALAISLLMSCCLCALVLFPLFL
jgi:hypothetical protein